MRDLWQFQKLLIAYLATAHLLTGCQNCPILYPSTAYNMIQRENSIYQRIPGLDWRTSLGNLDFIIVYETSKSLWVHFISP
jgi:hypothetical protein